MLKNRFVNTVDMDRLICLTYLYLLDRNKAISRKTIERRLQTPIEKIAPEKLEIFTPILRANISDLQNENMKFWYEGKKWKKEERRVGE